MSNKIKELNEKRLNLITEARKKYDELSKRAAEGDTEISAEDEASVDKMFDEVTNLDNQIDRELRFQDMEARLREPLQPEIRTGVNDVVEVRGDTATNNVLATPEYTRAFENWVRHNNDSELRALEAGNNTEGGYTVPESFLNRLIQGVNEMNFMRGLATVINTSGLSVKIPSVSAHGAASITDEEAAYSESDETFGQTEITIYKLTRLIKVTEELLADSAFNLESSTCPGSMRGPSVLARSRTLWTALAPASLRVSPRVQPLVSPFLVRLLLPPTNSSTCITLWPISIGLTRVG